MTLNEHLATMIEQAVAPLPAVARRQMFGCAGWFARDNVFALVWKEGRIGVRLPDGAQFSALMALEGADPWRPGGKMTMSHWVLVPESFHDDAELLGTWVQRAHSAAFVAPPKVKRATSRKAASATKARTTPAATAQAGKHKASAAKSRPAKSAATKARPTKFRPTKARPTKSQTTKPPAGKARAKTGSRRPRR